MDRNQLTRVKTMLNIKAERKPLTAKPETTEAAMRIIMVLMTKVNKPRVRKFMGRVKITRKGFRKVLRTPKTTETITAIKKELTSTPGVI